ncbi:hypothetical protein [Bacillus velezensis]
MAIRRQRSRRSEIRIFISANNCAVFLLGAYYFT